MKFYHSKDGVCLLCNKNQAMHNEWEATLTNKTNGEQTKVMILTCNECDEEKRKTMAREKCSI